MKTKLAKLSTIIAGLALAITATNVNSICYCWMHQPKLPDGAESLRRK